MCGLFGITARVGLAPSLDDAAVARLRDRMQRRGPDGAGLWRHENIVLAHRRLAVIDPSPSGAQPMLLATAARDPAPLHEYAAISAEAWQAQADLKHLKPRLAIVYNGELYNDADLRAELSARGSRFRSTSDTETILHAWAAWGVGALSRFRGMYALAIVDLALRTVTLARDPLGIKPLYYAITGDELIFASDPTVLTAHPGVGHAADLEMVSAYLTTIRTVLGERTLFAGVHALTPGQMLQCDLSGRSPTIRLVDPPAASSLLADDELAAALSGDDAPEVIREILEDSVRRHLRADVPTCCLLSGGLDSTIVSSIARSVLPHPGGLRTYCAGAPLPATCLDSVHEDDLAAARRIAGELGTSHAEAHISREYFAQRWPWMIDQMGVPLSTPNEVAIHAVAARLRQDGCVVTLSGEGADELFGGYETPNRQAVEHVRAVREHGASASLLELQGNAWVRPEAKAAVLSEKLWKALDNDSALLNWHEREFDRATAECPGGATGGGGYDESAHLRMRRRLNLTGLLQRLDTATMLAGVEGRTPFADAVVLAVSELVPLRMKFALAQPAAAIVGTPAARAEAEPAQPAKTKIILREAFKGRIPAESIQRAKASFPLPFETWMSDHAHVLRTSPFARATFSDAAIEAVSTHPAKMWWMAWPMINLALWARRF